MPAEKSHMFLKKLITVPYLILPFASWNVTETEDTQILCNGWFATNFQ
jgi:hypothetical protein